MCYLIKSQMKSDKSLKGFRRILRKKETSAEKKLWQYLRRRQVGNFKFLRQFSIENYIVDFYCPQRKLAIEIDGGQHFKSKNDGIRCDVLNKCDVKILRFWNYEIFKNIDGVLMKIREELGLEN